MNPFWNPLLNQLDPYVPGEQPQDKKYIKLNTNENPYPPSPHVIQAIRQAANETLRLYPDPEASELRKVIAKVHDLTPGQVFVGNGSDEVLAFSFLAFFDPARTILFPDITYSFYPVYAGLFQNKHRLIPLNDDFSLPLEAFLQENGGIIFPNPNAPTGLYLPVNNIEYLLEKNTTSPVIIDEAYIAFGGDSVAGLINKYPNLLVIRTLSKSHSLAGLRVGYALGNAQLIAGLNRIKSSVNSYTLDRLALAGAAAAIADTAYYEETGLKIIATREKTISALQALGFKVIPSLTNFIFVSHPYRPAQEIYQGLKEKGILVRYFNKPRINNYLRISIGRDAEMASFLQAVGEILH